MVKRALVKIYSSDAFGGCMIVVALIAAMAMAEFICAVLGAPSVVPPK